MSSKDLFPEYRSEMEYVCQDCSSRYSAMELHYTCPSCGGVFLLVDKDFDSLGEKGGQHWREMFDTRAACKDPALSGIFRFYELMAPILEREDIVWLGEAQTPIINSTSKLESEVGQKLAFKNDGQNPSASFKDRGMACAFSYLQSMVRRQGWDQILTVCASTGDTSASAAMYAAYVGDPIKSVVLLPKGKVTPQQLSQPLGSGATVLELPGYFDECMMVVEYLADNYRVALLNSKNSWRILGQESYAYEIAQWYDWDLSGKVVYVPIGNAGNISAVLSGFLKLYQLGIITALPRVIGVQSHHADPVYRYYSQTPESREYQPVDVKASVAQAAMIGNPVSFPRVRTLVEQYLDKGGRDSFTVVQVEEQEIIEAMLRANKYGHIACTQGGECLAGLLKSRSEGLVDSGETAILDATAHTLKFQDFQEKYFDNDFPPEYGIEPKPEYVNRPEAVFSDEVRGRMEKGEYIVQSAREIVKKLGL